MSRAAIEGGLQNLRVGKAAEHLVVADLILQGFPAYLAYEGMPYDVVIDHGGSLHRIQVKAVATINQQRGNIYRFDTRRDSGKRCRTRAVDCDYYALVALDIKTIAYFPIAELLNCSGNVKQNVNLRSRLVAYNYTQQNRVRYIQDYSRLLPC